TRYRIDLERATIVDRAELPYTSAPDFPVLAASDACRPYRDFWALGISATGRPGRKFFDQLAHGDWADRARVEVYQAPPHSYFGGEPVFVADPYADRAGVILCPMFDAARCVTSFGLFDAFAVSAGPVAVIRLRGAMHLSFHGTFVPQQAGPHR